MLEIKKVTKVYDTAGFKQKALDEVSVCFRECEFVSILGPSGSGKTTLLNIIGGLDHYTSGDLIINETSTKEFKDSSWDSYRNHRIGFVFQNYNLINHQSILMNVRLALTLSGISKKESIIRAKKALKEVGLEKHIYKKPNQLSGGQMQRVAIARALVNNPDILLADEPTGALDSETSVQIMLLLKNISKDKLVIMVTHNPELAQLYSTRIINLKDGKITSDTDSYNGKLDTTETLELRKDKSKKTNMSFLTALSLSFNNLMTKRGRTILIAFAGSIGIIGIALILAVSTGFQNYINKLQEDTLTSYPLTITEKSANLAETLLSMTTGSSDNNGSKKVKEQQYITNAMTNISANDLKSFKNYLESNYEKVSDSISNLQYSYSIDPLIYTVDATNKLAKVNPSNLFSSMTGSNLLLSSYSSMSSVFSQMVDNTEDITKQYDLLEGKWPEKYDEMIIVLSQPNTISDLLVYSLGLRDTEELTTMVTKMMSGQNVDTNNKPLEISYEDLLKVKLKLVMPADIYKYNEKYKVYEDMSQDNAHMSAVYDKSTDLKIVGIVCPKSGSTSMALSPGVAYTSSLIDYIISNSQKSQAVQKQLSDENIDVFSNTRFDSKNNSFDFGFEDLVKVDEDKLKKVFNVDIDKNEMERKTQSYMANIASSIDIDFEPALTSINNGLNVMAQGVFSSISDKFSKNDVDDIVDDYMESDEANNVITSLQKKYYIPKDIFENSFKGILKGLLNTYIIQFNQMDSSLTEDEYNPYAMRDSTLEETVIRDYYLSPALQMTKDILVQNMTEAVIKKEVLIGVGQITNYLTQSIQNSFNIDANALSSAFSLNFTEDELTRVVGTYMNRSETNAKTNLILLGYQSKDEPTYISLYFNSFEGKEKFLEFLDQYNEKMNETENKEKVINYSDTTGILMNSVKTIVNAVSYVLIAFVSISLIVSSIMIGIITFISVYERTKEIGILRSIGASKRNISSIFNAETFIIGLLSGIIGIGISYMLIPVINTILHHYTGNLPLDVMLNIKDAMILVVLSVFLTLIGGLIPARAASKKDPVEALRSE